MDNVGPKSRRVKQRPLTKSEQQFLLQVFNPEPDGERFLEFAKNLEWILPKYVALKKQWAEKAPTISGAASSLACREIEASATKLRGALNRAPIEAFQRLDAAHRIQAIKKTLSEVTEPRTHTWDYGSDFFKETNPLLKNILESLDELIEIAPIAASRSAKQYFGGRPPNAPLTYLAIAIANEFVNTLEIRPTKTPTGVFTQILQQSLQFVSNDTQEISVSRYVRAAVDEMKSSEGQSGSELPEPAE